LKCSVTQNWTRVYNRNTFGKIFAWTLTQLKNTNIHQRTRFLIKYHKNFMLLILPNERLDTFSGIMIHKIWYHDTVSLPFTKSIIGITNIIREPTCLVNAPIENRLLRNSESFQKDFLNYCRMAISTYTIKYIKYQSGQKKRQNPPMLVKQNKTFGRGEVWKGFSPIDNYMLATHIFPAVRLNVHKWN